MALINLALPLTSYSQVGVYTVNSQMFAAINVCSLANQNASILMFTLSGADELVENLVSLK